MATGRRHLRRVLSSTLSTIESKAMSLQLSYSLYFTFLVSVVTLILQEGGESSIVVNETFCQIFIYKVYLIDVK